jgi:hypothetical protein
MNRRAFLLLGFVGLFAGCNQHHSSRFSPYYEYDRTMNLRLEAALTIDNPDDRDEALKAIAIESADQGRVQFVDRSLVQISNARHDETAADCAWRLYRSGLPQPANRVAMSINDQSQRDASLKLIAKGG